MKNCGGHNAKVEDGCKIHESDKNGEADVTVCSSYPSELFANDRAYICRGCAVGGWGVDHGGEFKCSVNGSMTPEIANENHMYSADQQGTYRCLFDCTAETPTTTTTQEPTTTVEDSGTGATRINDTYNAANTDDEDEGDKQKNPDAESTKGDVAAKKKKKTHVESKSDEVAGKQKENPDAESNNDDEEEPDNDSTTTYLIIGGSVAGVLLLCGGGYFLMRPRSDITEEVH
jgi:hypothetical protein